MHGLALVKGFIVGLLSVHSTISSSDDEVV
jgi:hypothetical protein